ncbi:class I SAM-dependent methyltransferase [Adhaeribacter swui]|uniref:Class I SAM-dependent methyltransferase n=1 Tax=Adhaeribacter swui TaxID=2086471 RepID=A0A7G7G6I9_9BACT|nr:class I SAM-dependent methyltransferase [Adhaeribacter swui]QNF32773.1 class I SAM-dependent methyltransferase [Adhaeribacter swui]
MYQQEEEWFSTWFNSPYYHILYRNQDVQEAHAFIDKLIAHLNTKLTYQLLEMGCGNGQHAVYLNQKGYTVTGLDFSEKNIARAKPLENEQLHFYQHDMRDIFRTAYYDLILNLFTRFGYFGSETENVVALRSTVSAIKPGGKLVIDFMNTNYAIQHLSSSEEKVIDGILFRISEKVEKGFIVKTISVTDQGQEHTFYEKVRALTYDQFMEYFRMTSLRLVNVFGSYDLEPYNPDTSERLIFVLKK